MFLVPKKLLHWERKYIYSTPKFQNSTHKFQNSTPKFQNLTGVEISSVVEYIDLRSHYLRFYEKNLWPLIYIFGSETKWSESVGPLDLICCSYPNRRAHLSSVQIRHHSHSHQVANDLCKGSYIKCDRNKEGGWVGKLQSLLVTVRPCYLVTAMSFLGQSPLLKTNSIKWVLKMAKIPPGICYLVFKYCKLFARYA